MTYSRLYRRKHARGRLHQSLPWELAPLALRMQAERIVAGAEPDPCGGRAWHWRSRKHDPLPANMRPVNCGPTRNQFLAMRSTGESPREDGADRCTTY